MKITKEKIQNRLEKLSKWTLDKNQISKKFKCKNFLSAIEFVNLIAERAEAMDHHPDILVSNYNQVTITLTTHSANGLTEKDFNLATKIEQVFKSHVKEE